MSTAAQAWYDAAADRAGLTRRQLLVWAGDRVAGGLPVFVEAARWYLDGPLDPDGLARAFAAAVASADALRMTVDEKDGWPVSRTLGGDLPEAAVVDLARHAWPRRAVDELGEAVVAACAPGRALLAAAVACLGADRHVLVLAQHQMVSDAWSFGLLHRRLEAEYRSRADDRDVGGTSDRPRFADYVAFERAYRRSPAAEAARRYWERTRTGGEASPSVGGSSTSVCRIVVTLGMKRSAAVRRVAGTQAPGDVGLFVFFAAVVAAHLHRTVDADDVVLDVPFANRPSARFKETLGTFMNVCPVRVDVARRDRVCDLRDRLAAATWEAARHQTFAGHGGSVPQAYDVLLNVHRPVVAAGRFDACAMRVEWAPPTHRFGSAAVAVHDFGATGELTLVVDLNERAFSPGSRAAFAASLLRVVDEHLGGADRRLADMDRAGPAGASSAAADAPPVPAIGSVAAGDPAAQATVWSRVVAQSRATPDAVALRCGDVAVPYGELVAGASDVARRVVGAGGGRDTVVAVWGARGPRWLRTLLGVLASGGVYLPLDPSWPAARVIDVLRRSGARILVADDAPPELRPHLAAVGAGWTLLAVDEPYAEALVEPPAGPSPHDVAYIFYTSGSTGAPKGALVEHAGLLNHLEAKVALLELGPRDRVAQSATAGFDVSLWQCLAPLIVGGAVEILPDEVVRVPATLACHATERRVTVLEVVPSMLRLLLDAEAVAIDEPHTRDALPDLRFLVVTGEALPAELCRRWFGRHPGTALVNAYGPTECADDVTHHVLRGAPPADATWVPIGRPIAGMDVHVLDAALRPVPDGEVGELCVAGIGVARGYLDDAERTAAAFVTCALGRDGGAVRVYRTGDRGRRLPDGAFVWLGRLDAQVKIRGVRVEPAEVEAVLGVHPTVRQVAVVSRPDAIAGSRLVAYVVFAEEDERGTAAVPEDRDHARVREWQRLWDDTYARESPAARDAAFDTAGWHSRYTRLPMPPSEMREWLEGTVARLRALAPRVVLEIGCGSGMVLARLAPQCDRWIAIDVSTSALEWVRRRHLAAGGLPHVEVEHGAADEIARFAGVRPDAVVLNSVVQYFPSLAYLRGVLKTAWAMLDDGGVVFLGDVRSLPLARMLHTSIEMMRAFPTCSARDLRARIERSLANERELLIDPGFFTVLARECGGTIDIELKRGHAHNELTRFRYDVVWRRSPAQAGPRGHDPTEAERARPGVRHVELAWDGAAPTLAMLQGRLSDSSDATFVLRGVPNPRLQREAIAVELLAAVSEDTTVAELREMLATHVLEPGIDPEDLWRGAGRAGHDVAIGWSAVALDRYDAWFRPRGPRTRDWRDVPSRPSASAGRPAAGTSVAAEAEPSSGPSGPYANDPCGPTRIAARIDELRAFARAQLPGAMVPAAFVALRDLPRTSNGKVDQAALLAREDRLVRDVDASPPASPLEQSVAAIWSGVLGVVEVGRDEDFFALGGDSLLVYRMIAALRAEIGVEVALDDVLQRPTVAGTAAAIAAAILGDLAGEDAEAILAEVEGLGTDGVARRLRAEGGAEEVADA